MGFPLTLTAPASPHPKPSVTRAQTRSLALHVVQPMSDAASLPQTVLFWTCEKYPRSQDWRVFRTGFLRLVRKLHKCVSQRFLKHFFVPRSNLLRCASAGELDTVAQRLALFLRDPRGTCPKALGFRPGLSPVDCSS